MPRKKYSNPFTLALTEYQYESIKTISNQENISMAQAIRKILDCHLQQIKEINHVN
jgi:hypothetical protein